ncbi:DUF4169 family protein [Kaistia nematophila]|uniref:DUF4169 family protein n=1 Tax=Kaistia nematophila TaxID=2994654 RepID=A0A9X3E150_9HYPH|nr:DUF4169 family protein [Kaistia nematophila]MBN9025185.1 DUF4169 family protein [Hyphomicrobiales bacterium]MCX5569444.1 DUF4169 family protein [Kaistia nematophila]
MTADIINLNRFRKEKARAEKAAVAEENRVRFGRTRAQKALDRISAEKARHHVDSHRRDDEEDPTPA